MIRGAESAARGFVVAADANLIKQYNDARGRGGPAFAELKTTAATRVDEAKAREANPRGQP